MVLVRSFVSLTDSCSCSLITRSREVVLLRGIHISNGSTYTRAPYFPCLSYLSLFISPCTVFSGPSDRLCPSPARLCVAREAAAAVSLGPAPCRPAPSPPLSWPPTRRHAPTATRCRAKVSAPVLSGASCCGRLLSRGTCVVSLTSRWRHYWCW